MMKKDSPFTGKKNALKKQKIYEILQKEVQLSTQELLSAVNAELKWGLSVNELGNLLARTKQFEKIGFSEHYGRHGKRYRVCVWGLNYD